MGYYVNPRTEKKETWLENNGTRCLGTPEWDKISEKDCIVCLVDNGPFKAAGICYKEAEFKDFQPSNIDDRPRVWYIVSKELVVANSDVTMEKFQ